MVRSHDHDDAQDHRVVTAFGIGDRHAAIGDHTNALPAGTWTLDFLRCRVDRRETI
jgi:hypothetical protein